jgi:hypothetical protein
MNHKMETKTNKLTSPSLSSAFLSSLTIEQQQLFYKLWRSLYDEVMTLKGFTNMGGILSCYWLVDKLRTQHNLRPAEFALLSMLWNATKQGKDYTTIDSLSSLSPRSFEFIRSSMQVLIKLGYAKRARMTKNLESASSRGRTGKYITVSDSGIKLMNSLHSELREMIYTTHVNSFKLPK